MTFAQTLKLTLAATLLLGPTIGAAASDNSRLAALERQVSNLQAQIHELTIANQRLAEKIAQITPAALAAPQSCSDHLKSLMDKQLHLQKMGFKDSHPDSVNVQRQIGDTLRECEGS